MPLANDTSHVMSPRWGALALSALLTTCSPVLAPVEITGPEFDPVRFFSGHVRSWGVLENRSGEPTAVVTTDCTGTVAPDGTLAMTQVLHVGTEPAQTRRWTMRRGDGGLYEATANDMAGTATGLAAGRAFHWQWTLELEPGNALKNVTMAQWWYLQDDGSMLNRTVISKLGIIAAEVTEVFRPDQR